MLVRGRGALKMGKAGRFMDAGGAGGGIELVCVGAGDFELACKGVFVGKRGESERRFIWLKVIINQQVSVIS
jgi:hypothetical protein